MRIFSIKWRTHLKRIIQEILNYHLET